MKELLKIGAASSAILAIAGVVAIVDSRYASAGDLQELNEAQLEIKERQLRYRSQYIFDESLKVEEKLQLYETLPADQQRPEYKEILKQRVKRLNAQNNELYDELKRVEQQRLQLK